MEHPGYIRWMKKKFEQDVKQARDDPLESKDTIHVIDWKESMIGFFTELLRQRTQYISQAFQDCLKDLN